VGLGVSGCLSVCTTSGRGVETGGQFRKRVGGVGWSGDSHPIISPVLFDPCPDAHFHPVVSPILSPLEVFRILTKPDLAPRVLAGLGCKRERECGEE